jgi:hypothetical protein
MARLRGGMIRRMQLTVFLTAAVFAVAALGANDVTNAQQMPRRVALKTGESVELHPIYWVSNCHSIMVGLPEVEVLEGPSELSLSIREEQVLPRQQGCAAKVPGGTLMLTAKTVTEKTEARLIYRVKYKTKDGDRQISNAYIVSLFP